ncbi:MAG: hypothetical protein KC486_32995 [Myxococcales bacterium]|nr:hypothetical protein [Myxococcales bacterium]
MTKYAALIVLSLIACAPKGQAPKGHASIARCHEGGIVMMEVPLSQVDEVEDFEDCGEGTCVAKGQACPKPAEKPAEPAERAE